MNYLELLQTFFFQRASLNEINSQIDELDEEYKRLDEVMVQYTASYGPVDSHCALRAPWKSSGRGRS